MKNLLCIALLLLTTVAFSQVLDDGTDLSTGSQKYVIVKYMEPAALSPRQQVEVDYGGKTARLTQQGGKLKVSTEAEVLNIMDSYGWDFVNSYINKDESASMAFEFTMMVFKRREN